MKRCEPLYEQIVESRQSLNSGGNTRLHINIEDFERLNASRVLPFSSFVMLSAAVQAVAPEGE